MGTFAKQIILAQSNPKFSSSKDPSKFSSFKDPSKFSRRGALSSSLLSFSVIPAISLPLTANAESWGTRSYVREKYFQPALSPEESILRIQQTADGLKEMRHMLDTMSWRYVLFYVRFKMAYLSSDLKNAMASLPESRRKKYVVAANEVVDNMTELDRYIRTPKVYESYLYYEKTLKSLDDILAQLA